MKLVRVFALSVLAGLLLVLSPHHSAAQQYPDRTVTIIVGFNAGGGTDTIARTLADILTKQWGKQVIVENRPGAQGAIGVRTLKSAAPDGYTLGMWSTSDVGNAAVQDKLGYDLVEDFVQISQVASGATVLVVNSKLPINSLPDYIGYAKKNPEKLNVSVVSGGDLHLDTIRINVAADIKTALIGYPGTAPGLTDVVGGHTDAILLPIGPAKPHIQSGVLRAIAVGSKARSELLPDVAPMSDTLPGFLSTFFYGLAAPKGTPADIVDKINAGVQEALRQPVLREKLVSLGFQAEGTSPQQYREILADKLKSSRQAATLAGMRKAD
ncbi:MAG: Bug family tripartite tricarboxylate transporter substrate binding protein [Bacteroidota bacterium]